MSCFCRIATSFLSMLYIQMQSGQMPEGQNAFLFTSAIAPSDWSILLK